jgi:UDP-N-acetylmuramoyl-tripeptide--D-alanyl-D-alanine ligase
LNNLVHYVTLATNALAPLTLASMSRCGRGRLAGHDRIVESISIDSRTLTAGALFVALKGELADGHDFATAAAARGASGLLVERELPIDLPQVVVPDTLAALTECARARRRDFAGPVVAVTGSNGKTTITSACPSRCCHCAPSTRTRLSKWARTIAARSRT